MRTLASERGLSDVWLAKICKREGIPRPGVGHWAKVKHGRSVCTVLGPWLDIHFGSPQPTG